MNGFSGVESGWWSEGIERPGSIRPRARHLLPIGPNGSAGWERQGKSLKLELVIKLAEILNTSIDELMGANGEKKTKKSMPTGRLRKTFERASRLSRRQQDKIAEFVEAFVEKYEASKS